VFLTRIKYGVISEYLKGRSKEDGARLLVVPMTGQEAAGTN